MNLTLKDYVLKTESVVRHVQDRTPGSEFIEKYWGTLDYATARFNTILIKLSQDQIKEVEHKKDIHDCFEIIQRFYDYTKNTKMQLGGIVGILKQYCMDLAQIRCLRLKNYTKN